eukprot:14143770-Alexandrium_andersonii.AAC.1
MDCGLPRDSVLTGMAGMRLALGPRKMCIWPETARERQADRPYRSTAHSPATLVLDLDCSITYLVSRQSCEGHLMS